MFQFKEEQNLDSFIKLKSFRKPFGKKSWVENYSKKCYYFNKTFYHELYFKILCVIYGKQMYNCPKKSSFIEITNWLSPTFNLYSESFLFLWRKKLVICIKKQMVSKDVRHDVQSCNSLKKFLLKLYFDFEKSSCYNLENKTCFFFWINPMLPFCTTWKTPKS